jgi:O-antigen/teichoic acid export membrane protein
MKIGKQAVKSTLFASINTYSAMGVGIISSIIMARLLAPEHFGIIALGNFFLALFGRVREFGLDYALIHRQDDLERAFKTHFTLQILLSLLNLALVIIAIPFLNNYYQADVITVLLILAFFTILKAASSTPRVYLEKELKFGVTTIVDITALLVSSSLGIGAALLGWGLWSLVLLNVTGISITFGGLMILSGWKWGVSWDREMIRWFLRFGFFLWVGGLTTFVIFQYNDFLLGTFVSVAALGFYTKAFQFAQLPTGLVTAVVSRVALPTYAKLQTDKGKLEVAFNLVLRNIFRASAPFSLLLFLIAEDFVHFFLGEKWLPMIPVFQLLLVFSMLRPIFDDTGAFLTAIGKPQILSKYLSAQALILLITAPVLVSLWQANGAAISLNIVIVIGVLLAYFYAGRFVRIHYRQNFLPTILAVGLTAFLYYLTLSVVPLEGLNLLLALIIKGILISSFYILSVYLVERREVTEDIKLFYTIMKEKSA